MPRTPIRSRSALLLLALLLAALPLACGGGGGGTPPDDPGGGGSGTPPVGLVYATPTAVYANETAIQPEHTHVDRGRPHGLLDPAGAPLGTRPRGDHGRDLRSDEPSPRADDHPHRSRRPTRTGRPPRQVEIRVGASLTSPRIRGGDRRWTGSQTRQDRARSGRPALLQRARERRHPGHPRRRDPAGDALRAHRRPHGGAPGTAGSHPPPRLRHERLGLRHGHHRGIGHDRRPHPGEAVPSRGRRGNGAGGDGDHRRPAVGSINNGGDLAFGIESPDPRLYMRIGDQNTPALSQADGSPAGRLLRFGADGSIPGDNPLPADPEWCRGLRNTFGIAVHPTTGTVFGVDNGPMSDDELNYLNKGKNFEWGGLPPMFPPQDVGIIIESWLDVIVPTALAWHDGTGWGTTYDNNLFISCYDDEAIRRFPGAAPPSSTSTSRSPSRRSSQKPSRTSPSTSRSPPTAPSTSPPSPPSTGSTAPDRSGPTGGRPCRDSICPHYPARPEPAPCRLRRRRRRRRARRRRRRRRWRPRPSPTTRSRPCIGPTPPDTGRPHRHRDGAPSTWGVSPALPAA